ncbi:MAG: hypothetical protein NWE92_02915 [Candidatus Bathyarchaeota archaeon]|nr:hypothetical protein [Candidatus Bathyarchaeota archaeon]
MVKRTFISKIIVVTALILTLSLPTLNVSAATLFFDGFENGLATNWTTQVGASTLTTAPVHSGNYAANFTYSTAACYQTRSITPTNTLNYTYYVNFKTLPTNYVCVVLARDAGGTPIFYRVQASEGVYQWRFASANTVVINSSNPTVTTGQWYKIQLLANTGENSTLYFLVNDQLRATITNLELGPITQLQIGNDWTDFGDYIPQGESIFDDVSATDAITTFVSAFADAGGSITPSGVISVPLDGTQTFTITADPHYHIKDVLVDDHSVGAVATYTFTNVETIHSIHATFELDTCTISAQAGSNGRISPSGNVAVPYGTDQTFTITANSGYRIANVVVNGVSVGSVSSYTFSNVQATGSISASFEANPSSGSSNTQASPTPSPSPTPTPTPAPTDSALPTATATPPIKQLENATNDYTSYIIIVVVVAVLTVFILLVLRRNRNGHSEEHDTVA